jgi:hypothetical protein
VHGYLISRMKEEEMDYPSDYERRLDSLVNEWNARIDLLEADARHAGPEFKKKYDDQISTLILDREAARRGLLRVEESGELCSSCPPEPPQNESEPTGREP